MIVLAWLGMAVLAALFALGLVCLFVELPDDLIHPNKDKP